MTTSQLSPPEAARELLRRRRIRASLTEFARFCGFEPARHHRLLIDKLEAVARGEIKRLMVFMPPGSAKALALDTPIPTPSGWKAMGDLRVGDQVFDEHGQPCNVTRVSEIWRDRPVYRVVTDCGDEIIADEDHEWLVRLCGKPRRPLKANGLGAPPRSDRDDPASQFKLKKTKELNRRRAKRPMIAHARALELPHADLPIDPYLLGVWLGDGHSAGMRITSAVGDQLWLRAELERLGVETRDSSQETLFGVIGMRGRFAALGLINDPAHSTHGRKHIPAAYMRASPVQRLALLQGLVDTDGTVCKWRGSTTFCSTNKDMADGVLELVRSLGVKASLSTGRAKLYGKDCGAVYRVFFYMAGSARMPRKAALARDQERTPNTYIDVRPAGRADTVCITVDSPSHLFLCGRSMTPTHNSTYVSLLFSLWWMALNPGKHVLAASYSADLAERWSRKVRALADEHGPTLGVALHPDMQSVQHWALTAGGEYRASGVGGSITGFRAWLGIIDDMVKNREEADSETMRERTWDWFVADYETRLVPDAPLIVIGTRWHDDDGYGRILKRDAEIGEGWDVVKLPAFATTQDPLGRCEGEPLWPEWQSAEALHMERARKGPREWAALYQQEPTPEGGLYFEREWLVLADPPPRSEMRIIGASDYAVTEGGGDYTVHWVAGIDKDGRLHLLDLYRKQAGAADWVDAFKSMVQTWQPIAWAEEEAMILKSVGPFLEKRMKEPPRAFVRRVGFPPVKDKPTRARTLQAMMADNKIVVSPSKAWLADFVAEMMSFPAGTHDDMIDALAILAQLAQGQPKVVTTPRPTHYAASGSILGD